MKLRGIEFRTSAAEIDKGAFAAAMLRHMVELKTGKLTDSTYNAAVKRTAAARHLPLKSGKIDFRRCSINSLCCLCDEVIESYDQCKVVQ